MVSPTGTLTDADWLDLATCRAPTFVGLLTYIPDSPTLANCEAAELRAPGYHRALLPKLTAEGRQGSIQNTSESTWPEVVATFFVIHETGKPPDLWGINPIRGGPVAMGPGWIWAAGVGPAQ